MIEDEVNMQTQWRNFLTATGAVFDGEQRLHFSNPQAEIDALGSGALCLHPRCDYGLVRVSGKDAQSFLQGQTSNDVSLVDAQHSQFTSYNHAKGRILALFQLYKHGDGYLIRLPLELLAPTVKRLRMFVLRADVQLTDISEQWAVLGVSGNEADSALRAIGLAVPPAPAEEKAPANAVAPLPKRYPCTQNGDAIVCALPGAIPSFEIIAPIAALQDVWQRLPATPVGTEAWRLLMIRAGIPEIFASTVETFVPQMVNLDQLGAISFTKGCYPGQEIVARMHYLGNLKKRMFHLRFAHTTAVAPGEKLYEAGTDNKQSVGEVVMCAASAPGHYEALAVLQIKSAEENSLVLGEERQIPIERRIS